jgi:hypothetical protein
MIGNFTPKGLENIERDVFMKLVEHINDDDKLRSLMGLSKQTFQWIRHPQFVYYRLKSMFFIF